MGINIKNDEVERLIRDYAEQEGLSLTKAIEQAIRRACEIEDYRASKAATAAAYERLLKAARTSTLKSDGPWTRDELYDDVVAR